MRGIALILLVCVASAPAMAKEEETAQSSLASDIERRVAVGWSKYDAADDGYLSLDEFSQWMNDLRGENGNGPANEAIMRAAFLVTDTDKDGEVSREELTAFMMSRNGVKWPAGG